MDDQNLSVAPGRDLSRQDATDNDTDFSLSLEEVAERLRGYEHAGCDRVMLQHLLHTDLEPVRLIGRDLAPALA